MPTTFSGNEVQTMLGALAPAHAALARRYLGETGKRQPVHTVYGGGHLFAAGTAQKLGRLAKKALAEHAPDAATFGRAIALPESLAATVYERVLAKLDREPV